VGVILYYVEPKRRVRDAFSGRVLGDETRKRQPLLQWAAAWLIKDISRLVLFGEIR
jgi:hypothetical protein